LWADRLDGAGPAAVRRLLGDHGLSVTALNRGGFFAADESPGLAASVTATCRMIDLAAELGAPTLVIVPGGMAAEDRDLITARARVAAGLAAVAPHARACGVALGIEPFHPNLTAQRGVVNRLASAIDLCHDVGLGAGVILDVYHLWWDQDIAADIARAGDLILGYHLCDYPRAPRDPLFDRARIGAGCADAVGLTRHVLAAGYAGPVEVEIFSKFDLWSRAPDAVATLCRDDFARHIREVVQP
jgi:sugar phosphate isomerase/epimerase